MDFHGNSTFQQCQSKAIGMQFYWVKDHVLKGEFLLYWAHGKENLADYFTKHHSLAPFYRTSTVISRRAPGQLTGICFWWWSSHHGNNPENIEMIINKIEYWSIVL
jgi:hypothetical protein